MKIDSLITMANQIGAFFEAESGEAHPDEAAKLVATHLRRYWEPRMRSEMITYFQSNGGEGLDEIVRNGVALLADGKV